MSTSTTLDLTETHSRHGRDRIARSGPRQRLLGGQFATLKSHVLSRGRGEAARMRLSYMNRQVSTDEVIYRNFEQALEFRIGTSVV